jgi:hypothetical protein
VFEFLASLTNILVQAYVDRTPYDDIPNINLLNRQFFNWANDCNFF